LLLPLIRPAGVGVFTVHPPVAGFNPTLLNSVLSRAEPEPAVQVAAWATLIAPRSANRRVREIAELTLKVTRRTSLGHVSFSVDPELTLC
jgi:hypothetical protein